MSTTPDDDLRAVMQFLRDRITERLATIDECTAEERPAAQNFQQVLETLDGWRTERARDPDPGARSEATRSLYRAAAIYADHPDFREEWSSPPDQLVRGAQRSGRTCSPTSGSTTTS